MINIRCYLILTFLSLSQLKRVQSNRPPRFLIDGQTEIVLRLKEGNETPVGELIIFENVLFYNQ